MILVAASSGCSRNRTNVARHLFQRRRERAVRELGEMYLNLHILIVLLPSPFLPHRSPPGKHLKQNWSLPWRSGWPRSRCTTASASPVLRPSARQSHEQCPSRRQMHCMVRPACCSWTRTAISQPPGINKEHCWSTDWAFCGMYKSYVVKIHKTVQLCCQLWTDWLIIYKTQIILIN